MCVRHAYHEFDSIFTLLYMLSCDQFHHKEDEHKDVGKRILKSDKWENAPSSNMYKLVRIILYSYHFAYNLITNCMENLCI